MSLHSTYFGAAGILSLFRTQGEAASYTPKGGSAAAIVVLASVERTELKTVGRNRREVRARDFTITNDPNHEYAGIVAPATNGTIDFGGLTYSVSGLEQGEGVWVLKCEWIGSTEKAALSFRGNG